MIATPRPNSRRRQLHRHRPGRHHQPSGRRVADEAPPRADGGEVEDVDHDADRRALQEADELWHKREYEGAWRVLLAMRPASALAVQERITRMAALALDLPDQPILGQRPRDCVPWIEYPLAVPDEALLAPSERNRRALERLVRLRHEEDQTAAREVGRRLLLAWSGSDPLVLEHFRRWLGQSSADTPASGPPSKAEVETVTTLDVEESDPRRKWLQRELDRLKGEPPFIDINSDISLDTLVSQLPLTRRAVKALDHLGLGRLRDVLTVDLLALFSIPNAGLKTVREVKVFVERWHEHLSHQRP